MEPAELLGHRLRSRRSSLGLTLMAVALRAGVSVPYVANLEKGRGNPTLDVIVALSEALDLPASALLDKPPDGVSDGPVEEVPPVLTAYARGRLFRRTTQRLAELGGRSVEEMRDVLLRALASTPVPPHRTLSRRDCRRVLDAFVLVLSDPDV
jgi:transcriptional regulator with XRE-family HTH domain